MQEEKEVLVEEKEVVLEVPKDDNREYRYFVLKNGMKCVIYNDPEGDREGAAVSVRVGSLTNPKELPGLAHFLEHMLFLGTKQFPGENEYSDYISTHGGNNNAYTAEEETNYYFDISKGGHLPQALKMFASFFKDPLFNQSSTDRELKAVDSENAKNYQNDMWKQHQLIKSLSNPEHPFSYFATGNKQTLDDIPKEKGINVRERLLDFHKTYYSSNIMTLAVAVAESDLDVYERIVREEFGAVLNKNLPADIGVSPDSPWSGEYLQRRVSMVPVKDRHKIGIIWIIPGVKDLYMFKPTRILSHLLGHEGEGSVFTLVREKGWCHSLVAGISYSYKEWAGFSVNLELTDEGLKHEDEIIKICYRYIEEIKLGFKSDKIEEIFEEAKTIARQDFEYQKKAQPFQMLPRLVSAMHNYQPEHLLSGRAIFFKKDLELVAKFLDYFTQENSIVLTSSKTYEDDCKLEEPWYLTKYKTEPLLPINIRSNEWKELKLPKKNDFLATDLSVLISREQAPKEEDKAIPKLIASSDSMDIWHKTDDRFHKPTLYCRFQYAFESPYGTPKRAALGSIWVRYLNFLMNEYAYDAEVAGLSFQPYIHSRGLTLTLSGFNQKAHVLLEAVLKKMAECEKLFTDERFTILQKKLARDYSNFWKKKPYVIGSETEKLLTIVDHRTVLEKQAVVMELSRADLIEYTRDMLRAGFLTALVHGNVDSQVAIMMSEMWSKILGYKPLAKNMFVKPRLVQIPTGNFAIEEKLKNPEEPCSCLFTIFQTGPLVGNHHLKIIGDLYELCTNEFQFDFLRTKNQIGYIAWAFWRSTFRVGTFKHILQSSTFTCAAIEEILLDFLVNKVSKFLEDMSEDAFADFRKSLLQAKLQKFASLREENYSHWNEIQDNQFCFNRKQQEAALVPKLEKSDVIEFYKKYIVPTGESCRKLSIHVKSAPNEKNPPKKEPQTKTCEEFKWIEDRVAFTKDCRAFPCFISYKTGDEEKEIILE